jgi:hypothetical protein
VRGFVPTAAVAVVAAFLAPSASGVEATVVPGVGIGKVTLGMTATQVKTILGGSYLVDEKTTVQGIRYVKYGWDFSTWAVMFRQRGETLRAVQVETTLRGQQTPKRIGVGSTLQQVARAYPHAVCGYYALLIVSRNGGQTVFKFDALHPRPTGKPSPLDVAYHVSEVVVRQPFRPQPEFRARCRDRWLEENSPTPGTR